MATTIKKPGFFAYLMAVVAPPFSLFFQGKILAGIISSVFMIAAFLLMWIPPVTMVIWFLMTGWAMVSLGNKASDAQAQNQANLNGEAVATALRAEREKAAN